MYGVKEASLTKLSGGESMSPQFQQVSYKNENNYVWLLASLNIYSIDQGEGNKMATQLQSIPHSANINK